MISTDEEQRQAPYEPQTAMLLTDQERKDLAEMATVFKNHTEWVTLDRVDVAPEWRERLLRKRALADRIIAAA